MTGSGKCAVCKIVALLAGVGALNWGLTAWFGLDLVAKVFGSMGGAAKIVYGLVGVAGLLLLVSLVKCCPGCSSKGCSTK